MADPLNLPQKKLGIPMERNPCQKHWLRLSGQDKEEEGYIGLD